MKSLNIIPSTCRIAVPVFMIIACFLTGAFADESRDRSEIEKLANDYITYLITENEEGLMSLVSDDYLDSWHDREGYRERIREIFSAGSDWKSSCSVKSIEFPEDGKASVVLDGMLECKINTQRTNSSLSELCNEFWIKRGGDYLRNENGAWKLFGSQEKDSKIKVSAGFFFTSPTDVQMILKLHDESGGITEAALSAPGFQAPLELSRWSVDEKENIAFWGMQESPYLDIRDVVFPMKLVVNYTGDDGTGIEEYELEKPEIKFPVPTSPAGTQSVNCPVEFKWRGISGGDAGPANRQDILAILDEDGKDVVSLDLDSGQAVVSCDGKLAPGAVYFYRVIASDGEGNHFASGMESFRAGPPVGELNIKYSFTGPEDVTEYSSRPGTWIGGVYLYRDKIIIADFLNRRLDVLDAETRRHENSFETEWPSRDYCVAGGKIYVVSPYAKSIRVYSFDGTPAGEWAFDSGEVGGPILCDEKRGRVLAANLVSGKMGVFDLSGAKTGETAMPEKTAAVGLGEDGGLLFADENGVFYRYSRDEEPVAEWQYPESMPRRRGVAVFDGAGNLTGILNPTFGDPESVENYPISLKEVGGKIYAGYLSKNECGRCAMFFDVVPGTAPVFTWDFR